MDNAKDILEFLFSSGLIQDITYGSNTLVYSNGEEQALPKSIPTSPWELMDPQTKNDSYKTQDIHIPFDPF